jgi:hypothetical protein
MRHICRVLITQPLFSSRYFARIAGQWRMGIASHCGCRGAGRNQGDLVFSFHNLVCPGG